MSSKANSAIGITSTILLLTVLAVYFSLLLLYKCVCVCVCSSFSLCLGNAWLFCLFFFVIGNGTYTQASRSWSRVYFSLCK